MNCWMNDERLDITRKYVHDMINSFVEDTKGTNYHNEYNTPYMMINSPDLQHLLVKSCYDDKYIVKWGEVGGLAGQSPAGEAKLPRDDEVVRRDFVPSQFYNRDLEVRV